MTFIVFPVSSVFCWCCMGSWQQVSCFWTNEASDFNCRVQSGLFPCSCTLPASSWRSRSIVPQWPCVFKLATAFPRQGPQILSNELASTDVFVKRLKGKMPFALRSWVRAGLLFPRVRFCTLECQVARNMRTNGTKDALSWNTSISRCSFSSLRMSLHMSLFERGAGGVLFCQRVREQHGAAAGSAARHSPGLLDRGESTLQGLLHQGVSTTSAAVRFFSTKSLRNSKFLEAIHFVFVVAAQCDDLSRACHVPGHFADRPDGSCRVQWHRIRSDNRAGCVKISFLQRRKVFSSCTQNCTHVIFPWVRHTGTSAWTIAN